MGIFLKTVGGLAVLVLATTLTSPAKADTYHFGVQGTYVGNSCAGTDNRMTMKVQTQRSERIPSLAWAKASVQVCSVFGSRYNMNIEMPLPIAFFMKADKVAEGQREVREIDTARFKGFKPEHKPNMMVVQKVKSAGPATNNHHVFNLSFITQATGEVVGPIVLYITDTGKDSDESKPLPLRQMEINSNGYGTIRAGLRGMSN